MKRFLPLEMISSTANIGWAFSVLNFKPKTTLPLPCGILISTLRVEISIPQSKGTDMLNYHAALRSRVKYPFSKKTQAGTIPSNQYRHYDIQR